MSNTALKVKENFTWSDYCTWPDDERWEIIDGEAFAMSPAPNLCHQSISRALTRKLSDFFDKHLCHVFVAPTDVKISEYDIVQPDLLVVCDESKMKTTHIEGAPTLIIEILSPATTIHDRGRKMDLYAAAGVKEVWLVTPTPSLIEVFVLNGKSYQRVHAYSKKEVFVSPTFKELKLDLNQIFDFPTEQEETLRVVKEKSASYTTPSPKQP